VANDPNVSWSNALKVDQLQEAHVEGTVPLAIVQGVVSAEAHSVVLDFAAGSCKLAGLADDNADSNEQSDQLRRWLTSHTHRFVIASFDFGAHKNLASLQPTTLKLNVTKSNAGNGILQVLIAAQRNQPSAPAVDVTEPIPTASGSEYSLLINSKILIEDVVVDGFNRGSGLVKLVAVAPDPEHKAWRAQTRNPMQFKGRIAFGGVFPEIEHHAQLDMTWHGSAKDGLALSPYISPGGNIDLQMTLAASYPIKISGSGQDQQIQFTAGPISLTATGVAENAVKPQLERFLHGDILNDMTAVSLSPLSDFVLKNLKVPGHFLRMSDVHVTGDLLIVGTLEEDGQ
jgi:hypothetical protein